MQEERVPAMLVLMVGGVAVSSALTDKRTQRSHPGQLPPHHYGNGRAATT